MRRALIILALAFGLSLIGCDSLMEATNARAEFMKAHPDYTITQVGQPDGRGGSSIVTIFIGYKKPGDTREYWTDWAYETKDGGYQLVQKGSENILNDTNEVKRP